MGLWQAILLGAVQGLTEFVPVSSTAHLFLVQRLLGLGNESASLSFDIVLHLGTALALIVVYARDLAGMTEEALRWAGRKPARHEADRALIVPLIVGTIPGVFAGLFLLKRFETHRTLAVVGASMLIACVYFFLSEWVGARKALRGEERNAVSPADSLWIGVAQGAAGLMAGFSRSGFTIATGRVRGLSRERAARFSFLLALPIILGAGAKTLIDLHRHPEPSLPAALFVAGFLSSAVFGFAAIRFLLTYLRTHSLRPFGAYLGLLGTVLLAVALSAR
jgi:undecaprenyl-diphosphatase